ncbi:MAG TPA: YraN family protein, partial [Actinobacteria bacterium]|nr:YraN family protein [Actinomycetota bacterium]
MNNDIWSNKKIGALGEAAAGKYIEGKSYQILLRNYSVPMGEIDLIAKKDNIIVFIEVKTRTNQRYGNPEESINIARVGRIRKVAQYFLKGFKGSGDYDIRFDIISILADRKKLERLSGKETDCSKIAGMSDQYCTIEHIIDA